MFRPILGSTTKALAPSIAFAFASALAHAVYAADSVAGYNIVLNPNNALEGVAGYASARHPSDVPFSLAQCPSGTAYEAPGCIHESSGILFSYTWEIIFIEDDSMCNIAGTTYVDYTVTTQNAQDSCSGSDCSQNARTYVFYGYRTCTPPPFGSCTWSWDYQGAINTPPNQTTNYQFSVMIAPGAAPDGILLGRSTQATTYPDPRWVEVIGQCRAT